MKLTDRTPDGHHASHSDQIDSGAQATCPVAHATHAWAQLLMGLADHVSAGRSATALTALEYNKKPAIAALRAPHPFRGTGTQAANSRGPESSALRAPPVQGKGHASRHG